MNTLSRRECIIGELWTKLYSYPEELQEKYCRQRKNDWEKKKKKKKKRKKNKDKEIKAKRKQGWTVQEE